MSKNRLLSKLVFLFTLHCKSMPSILLSSVNNRKKTNCKDKNQRPKDKDPTLKDKGLKFDLWDPWGQGLVITRVLNDDYMQLWRFIANYSRPIVVTLLVSTGWSKGASAVWSLYQRLSQPITNTAVNDIYWLRQWQATRDWQSILTTDKLSTKIIKAHSLERVATVTKSTLLFIKNEEI